MARNATVSNETDESPHDYVRVARRFAQKVIADKKRIRHCRRMQQAAKRFLADLKRATKPRCPFVFDPWYANDACDFIEKLPHVEGKWDSETIVLHESHVFFVVQLFGFRDRLTGLRRFTQAIFNIARKNAKSTLAAAIALYVFCCEHEPGAQVLSAATTYKQAAIIFLIAKAMVEKTPELRAAFDLVVWAKALENPQDAGMFSAIHAKAKTQDGLNPSLVLIDEVHAHLTADLVNVLTSAAGARQAPLFLYTTTEGYLNPGPWSELRKFARNILDGLLGNKADHVLALIFEIDEEDDPLDPKVWIKANPLMPVNPILRREILKQATEAQGMPSKMSEFLIKRCNRQASGSSGWIILNKFKRGEGPLNFEWLKGYPAKAAFDLASNRDFVSWRITWHIDDIYYTFGRRWVPKDTVHQRTAAGSAAYEGWVEAGHLIQTEGETTDYAVVEAQIRADCNEFNIEQIGYDPWNAAEIATRLLDDDYPLVKYIQGPKSFHPAMSELERVYVGKRLRYAPDPVLLWCASNLVVRRDVNLNMAPDRKRSADKIDDMVSLIMTIGLWIAPDEDEDDFDDYVKQMTATR